MRILPFVCLIFAAQLGLRAQTNSGPIASTNAAPATAPTNAPTELRATEIQSKSCQFFMRSNVFIYRDDVHIDNPQMKLKCELLTVEAPKMTNGNRFNRATAETNVVIDWVDNNGTNHATSDKAVYTYAVTNLLNGQAESHFETNATVVLTGNPVVTNRSTVFYGDPIIWDRIKDSIESPNFHNQIIIPGGTNTSSLFEPPTSKPAKTNAPAK